MPTNIQFENLKCEGTVSVCWSLTEKRVLNSRAGASSVSRDRLLNLVLNCVRCAVRCCCSMSAQGVVDAQPARRLCPASTRAMVSCGNHFLQRMAALKISETHLRFHINNKHVLRRYPLCRSELRLQAHRRSLQGVRAIFARAC
jgi:hypothetical protein